MGHLESSPHADPLASVLFGLIFILISAKLGGFIAEKLKQPSVLGEIIAGIVLGNLSLLGLNIFESFGNLETLRILAELGVILLLFEIGLETRLKEMLAVGPQSFLVAVLGVIAPFVLGYFGSAYLMPELETIQRIFLGAILTATSVGITARVFKDLNFARSTEARIVLGAAVIDDVLGLVILAVVSGIAQTGQLDFTAIAWITAKAFGFLVLFTFLGAKFFKFIIKSLAQKRAEGLMLCAALALCFIGSFLASQMGLAAIVGAFASGLILSKEDFKYNEKDDYEIAAELKPINAFLVPLFFVITGMQVNLTVLGDTQIVLAATAITVIAIVSKIISGWAFKSKEKINRLIIGVGMIPRGEVGLIFASVGKSLGVVDDNLFAITVIVVISSTLIAPLLLNQLIKK